MEEHELELMPFSFIKKYGTFLNVIRDHSKVQRTEESRAFEGRWDSVKNMDKLLTNEEK
jgi:hypothetical protein